MTFDQLAARITKAIAQRQITTKRGGSRPRVLPQSYLRPILSTARTTLTYQIARRRGVTIAEALLLLRSGEDVAPYLMSMPAAALERARGTSAAHEIGHRRPGNAAHLARLALRLGTGQGTHQVWSKGGGDLVPEAWRSVVEAVEASYAGYGESTRRSQATVIRAFARAAWNAGFETPHALPNDRGEVQRRLQQAGLGKDSYANIAINTYNRAARALGANGLALPVLSQRVDGRLRGLRTLPCDAFGSSDDHSHDRTPELLTRIAPAIDESLRQYQSELRGKDEKPKMMGQRRAHIGRIVALLWKHRELLASARSTIGGTVPTSVAECELTDLYALEVPPLRRPLHSTSGDDKPAKAAGIAARLSRRAGNQAPSAICQPLIRVLLDAAAEEIRQQGHRDTSRLPYQPSVRTLLDTATKVTRDVLRAAAQDHDSTDAIAPVLACVNAVHRVVQAHMKETNAIAVQEGRAVSVDKAKALIVSRVTLPQLVCVGLPRLAERCRSLEHEYHTLLRDLGRTGRERPERHEGARRLKDLWYDALEEYIALAIFTAHPLRLSNIAYGRIASTPDAEWCLDVEYSPHGDPVRIRSVRGHFADRLRQPANPIAALKQRGKEQIWPWWPAVIDHDLLLRYLMTVRRDRIVARALLRDEHGAAVTAETYCLRNELLRPTLALFLPAHNLKKDRNRLSYNGGFAGSSLLSDIAGRGLHRVTRDVLGHADVPEFDQCGRGRWRGLFAGHIVRLLWSTYWYGLRRDLERSPLLSDGTRVSGKQIAEWATTDEERTLAREYTSVSAEMTARLLDPVDSWTHPRAYDAWMDRALRQEVIDWSTEDVPLPPHLASVSRPAPAMVPTLRRRRRVR